MIVSTLYPTSVDSDSFQIPATRQLLHVIGCPLSVWWSPGRCRNRSGEHWRCWYVYLEYRDKSGASRYRQLQLPIEAADNPQIWQHLAQVELPGACLDKSRARLIGQA